ncbi:histone H2B subacrosomal variant-like [Tamandua tetradactyla]|uniref:histone H2B subacrosomal variant-like n=1 Tax=Tamandua tetradactyla TaxID=48850 RepID=UPI0040548EE9
MRVAPKAEPFSPRHPVRETSRMARSTGPKPRCSREQVSVGCRRTGGGSVAPGRRNYALYVNRVRREVAPQQGMASRTLGVMNTLINSIFERIAAEACSVMGFRKRCTLTPGDIQKAVYTLLPAKLAKHAVAFGSEAVSRYVRS